MSYDQYGDGSDLPPENGPVAQPTEVGRAKQRVQAPAISLIVIGILNLLLAAVPALYGVGVSKLPPDELEKAMREQNPKAMEELKARGMSLTNIRNLLVYGSLFWAGADFLASLLVILGGIRMLALKNYGLALLAAILAALPGLSCSGCCGIGAVLGIWSLIVLIDTDVRATFQ